MIMLLLLSSPPPPRGPLAGAEHVVELQDKHAKLQQTHQDLLSEYDELKVNLCACVCLCVCVCVCVCVSACLCVCA